MSHPEILPLSTPRLILRRFTEADLGEFFAYRNDPKVTRYQGFDRIELDAATAFVRHHATQTFGIPDQPLQIAIAWRETNELIGDCMVRIHAADPRQATIGGSLARRFHRQGLAAEALSGLLDGLFGSLELHRVVADTDEKNIPAARLMEQLGLRREGHLRQSLWFKGRWADEYIYAMLREEWVARKSRAE